MARPNPAQITTGISAVSLKKAETEADAEINAFAAVFGLSAIAVLFIVLVFH